MPFVTWWQRIQGGEDSEDVLSCRSFFAKEPLIIGLFCGKWPMRIRHPMTLRHPVSSDHTETHMTCFVFLNLFFMDCFQLLSQKLPVVTWWQRISYDHTETLMTYFVFLNLFFCGFLSINFPLKRGVKEFEMITLTTPKLLTFPLHKHTHSLNLSFVLSPTHMHTHTHAHTHTHTHTRTHTHMHAHTHAHTHTHTEFIDISTE